MAVDEEDFNQLEEEITQTTGKSPLHTSKNLCYGNIRIWKSSYFHRAPGTTTQEKASTSSASKGGNNHGGSKFHPLQVGPQKR